jgi:mediator of RNA polymerase II transcription subunit 12
MNQLLDAVAKAVVDVFDLSQPQISVKEETDQSGAALKKRAEVTSNSISPSVKPLPSTSISLIAPLVSKLPSNVQGRILKVASQVRL